jgi:hypothetical protein
MGPAPYQFGPAPWRRWRCSWFQVPGHLSNPGPAQHLEAGWVAGGRGGSQVNGFGYCLVGCGPAGPVGIVYIMWVFDLGDQTEV